MKIAAWNCNCNWNSGKLKWKMDLLNAKCGEVDVVFLMESPDDGLHDFHGIVKAYPNATQDKRGVGLYLNPNAQGLTARLVHLVPPDEFAFALGYEITCNAETVNFLGLWNYPKEQKYGRTWRGLLERSADFLRRPNVVLMGDFNIPVSNGSADEKDIAEAFSKYGLTWIKTTGPTWYRHKKEKQSYHIDFCAVSPHLEASSHLSTGSFEDFVFRRNGKASASDHLPLILEMAYPG